MIAAVACTTHRVRVALLDDAGSLQALTEAAIERPEAASARACALLPATVGEVRVLLGGEQLLLRHLTMPEGPEERVARCVQFECLQEGQLALAIDWHASRHPDGELRICCLAVAPETIAAWRRCLEQHGHRLAAISHLGVGLYHAWRQAGGEGDALLIDVGGSHTQLVAVARGQLLALRSLPQGMEPAGRELAGSADPEQARVVLASLRPDSDAAALEVVRRQAAQVALAVLSTLKLLKAQLRLAEWKPAALLVAGAGAQAPGVLQELAQRCELPVRPLNPFLTVSPGALRERFDAFVALPSPWAAVLGAASAPRLALDVLEQERRERRQWWRSSGLLIAAAACALLSAALCVWWTETTRARLRARQPTAEQQALQRAVEEALARRERAQERLRVLARHRQPTRAASEMLAAIDRLLDPELCPIVLSEFRLQRQGEGVIVELLGQAGSTERAHPGAVVRHFIERLRAAYPPIRELVERTRPVEVQRLPFHLVCTISEP
ncbi:MAG: hypothetical protein N3B15_09335 [Planctomycetota bacterium]|nr:hypothetical protein [Planctomycetota bacterium]